MQLASEDLPTIIITINKVKYLALIDTGSSFSIMDEKIKEFKTVKINPIPFTTVNGRDEIRLEAHSPAPEELNFPKEALVRWKVINL